MREGLSSGRELRKSGQVDAVREWVRQSHARTSVGTGQWDPVAFRDI